MTTATNRIAALGAGMLLVPLAMLFAEMEVVLIADNDATRYSTVEMELMRGIVDCVLQASSAVKMDNAYQKRSAVTKPLTVGMGQMNLTASAGPTNSDVMMGHA